MNYLDAWRLPSRKSKSLFSYLSQVYSLHRQMPTYTSKARVQHHISQDPHASHGNSSHVYYSPISLSPIPFSPFFWAMLAWEPVNCLPGILVNQLPIRFCHGGIRGRGSAPDGLISGASDSFYVFQDSGHQPTVYPLCPSPSPQWQSITMFPRK